MSIIISSAYSLDSQKGNSITARRISSLLGKAGQNARAICDEQLPACDTLIALHATKTLHHSRRFKRDNPQGNLIIYLTGTDLYRELPAGNPDFFEALELADYLVVSQSISLSSIPVIYQHKARVVTASVELPEITSIATPPQPSLALVGHLRAVKNPFLLTHALALLPDLDIHAYSIGESREEEMSATARKWEQREERYRWLGNLPHSDALGWMQQVTATLNTSHLEGGANSIAESIVLGTPVLASRIEGNLGMLGDDYAGYFTPNSPTELANLIHRTVTDPAFLAQLQQQVKARQANFSTEQETAGWLTII